MTENLKSYRLKLFKDALALEKPDRIPHRSYYTTWVLFDSGFKLIDCVNDYELQKQAVINFYNKYKFDCMATGAVCTYKICKTLGTNWYNLDIENDIVSCIDQPMCENYDEIKEFIAEPRKFIYEKWMRRKFQEFNDEMPASRIQDVFDARAEMIQANMDIMEATKDFDIVPMTRAMAPITPLEHMINYYVGIKGMPVLLRRNTELFKDFAAAIFDYACKPAFDMINAMPDGEDMTSAFDGHIMLLAHTLLSPKQFDEFYWPYIDLGINTFLNKGKTVYIQLQGEGKRFLDHLADIPKGRMCLHPEKDDVIEVHKMLPNLCMMGGMPIQMLAHSTPEDCVAEAKRVIDAFEGKGFILSQDRMGAYRYDTESANLKAVSDFVQEYRI